MHRSEDGGMHGAYHRDRAVRRASLVTRGVIAASVACSAAFGALIALAQPSRARTTTNNASTPPATTPSRPQITAPSATTPATVPAPDLAPSATAPRTTTPLTAPPDTTPATVPLSPAPMDPTIGGLQPPAQAPISGPGGGGMVVSGQS